MKKVKAKQSKIKSMILVGIAILLGAAVFNQQREKSSANPVPSPSPTVQPLLLPANLTDDEKFILNPPSVEASRSTKQKHAQTVAKLAKQGSSLEIKECQPTPLVLEVKENTEFIIKNLDSVSKSITFDEDHQYKIPGSGATTIKADFKYGTGDYGYICSEVGLTGFLHIIP